VSQALLPQILPHVCGLPFAALTRVPAAVPLTCYYYRGAYTDGVAVAHRVRCGRARVHLQRRDQSSR